MHSLARESTGRDLRQGLGLRRLRQNPWIRDLAREVRVVPEQLLQPLFVVDGISRKESLKGLTRVYRDTPDSLLKQIEEDLEQGVRKFLLFGVPEKKSLKDFDVSFTTRQIAEIKKRFGDNLFLSVDVCLCSSTEHGQCGILNDGLDHVLNGETVETLAKVALEYAQAGADCVAPSDMMDGRVRAIRERLDLAGLERTLVMSYAAKFHSKFYGPFRAAADSAPSGEVKIKDRSTYQIDPGRPKDALLSSLRDAEEGADILMVKPGLPYLDILSMLSKEIPLPWAAYEVSGEFSAIEFLAEKGLADGPKAHVECWTSLVRAGAQMVITYGARSAKKWLSQGE